MSRLFLPFAAVCGISLGYVVSEGLSWYQSTRPVAVDAEIVRDRVFANETHLHIRWRNDRPCEYKNVTALMGLHENPEYPRQGIERDLGRVIGSRGSGVHETVEPWVFTRPEEIDENAEFILTAWHDCNGVTVASPMLVVPIREIFPEREE